MSFESLTRCSDLKGADIAEAARSSVAMAALLKRFEEIAKPRQGAPLLLAAIARLATTAGEWLDGELRVELSGETSTTITILTTIGGGFREKVFSDTRLAVPLEEFKHAIERTPNLVKPLAVQVGAKRVVLSASAEIRKTSLPPPMIEIDSSSLFFATPPTARSIFVLDTPDLAPLPPPAPHVRPAPRLVPRAAEPMRPAPAVAAPTSPTTPKTGEKRIVLRRRDRSKEKPGAD